MLTYVQFLTEVLVDRVRSVRADDRRDRGASALEWAIIAAIAVVIASVIGYTIYTVVNNKSDSIQKCANVAVGAKCDTGGGG
ncbi:MAG: hypothetical protein ACTHMS_15940 [Jatrophihabitans sp.]|uniref:hypothetical protein n=1 Tax=Jatrophihabitans sp. TaxID=1932789 RepID=UPI003F81E6C6